MHLFAKSELGTNLLLRSKSEYITTLGVVIYSDSTCGGGRICTYVGTRPADLQSALVDCLSTPPYKYRNRASGRIRTDDLFIPLEPTPRFELGTYALQKHCSAVELGRL